MTATQISPAGFGNGQRGRFNVRFFTTFGCYIAHIARTHKQAALGGIAVR